MSLIGNERCQRRQGLLPAAVTGIIPKAAVDPVKEVLELFGFLDRVISSQGLAGVILFLLLPLIFPSGLARLLQTVQ